MDKRLSSILLVSCLLSACGNDSTLSDCTGTSSHPVKKTNAKTIEIKVSSEIYNADTEKLERTNCQMVEKVKKAFELFESIPEVPLYFEYTGATGTESRSGNPVINVDLTGSRENWNAGVSGDGGFYGSIPNNYTAGVVTINTKYHANTLAYNTLLHEVGHSLGLGHAVSYAATMHCGTHSWGDYDYLILGMQEIADMIDLWGIDSNKMSVSGTVVPATADPTDVYTVYLVDTVTGVTFADFTDSNLNFKINVVKSLITDGTLSGHFNILAKGYSEFDNDIVASFWIDNNNSSNDYSSAGEIVLSSQATSVDNISIKLIDGHAEADAHNAYVLSESSINPGALLKGTSGKVVIGFDYDRLQNPTSIAVYGSSPDVVLSDLRTLLSDGIEYENSYQMTATVAANAVPGDRLIVVRAASGLTDVGLYGLQVAASEAPSYFGFYQEDEQFSGKVDFSNAKTTYWKW